MAESIYSISQVNEAKVSDYSKIPIDKALFDTREEVSNLSKERSRKSKATMRKAKAKVQNQQNIQKALNISEKKLQDTYKNDSNLIAGVETYLKWKELNISNADRLALENDLLSMDTWILDAAAGMVNKSVKSTLKKWMPILKKSLKAEGKNVPASTKEQILAIKALPEFKPYNYCTFERPLVEKNKCNAYEIFSKGFQIKDYEKVALDAFYLNPEDQLIGFIENKIDCCRKRFVKEWEVKLTLDSSIDSYPAAEDQFIEYVVQRPDYKNRIQREAEMQKNEIKTVSFFEALATWMGLI